MSLGKCGQCEKEEAEFPKGGYKLPSGGVSILDVPLCAKCFQLMLEMRSMKQIICVCNYGQVRSATMVMSLRDLGFPESYCVGAMNTPFDILNKVLAKAGLIVVCNKIELEELYSKENFGKTDEEKRQIAELFTNKYKDKVMISPIGRDIWGAPPGKPELRKICDDWINENKQDIEKRVSEVK